MRNPHTNLLKGAGDTSATVLQSSIGRQQTRKRLQTQPKRKTIEHISVLQTPLIPYLGNKNTQKRGHHHLVASSHDGILNELGLIVVWHYKLTGFMLWIVSCDL
jgi:hypothetical protein